MNTDKFYFTSEVVGESFVKSQKGFRHITLEAVSWGTVEILKNHYEISDKSFDAEYRLHVCLFFQCYIERKHIKKTKKKLKKSRVSKTFSIVF